MSADKISHDAGRETAVRATAATVAHTPPGHPLPRAQQAASGSAGFGRLEEAIRKPPWARLQSERPIAAGGMGTIDVVVDDVLHRRLARKLIHPSLQEQDATLQMFVREARITGRLSHPNIVPVHEIGYDPEGRLYFTMKLIEGRTLHEIIETRARVELSRDELFTLLEAIIKVCDALAFAHSNDVLHCDIKPENIMIGNFGEVYLMDWGIAHVMGERSESGDWASAGSADDLIMGTAHYMSPEQAGSPRHQLDQRADLFSLGATLFEVLTKRPPYTGRNALVNAQAGRAPTVCEVVGSGKIPHALERIVARALAPMRSDRYPSVAAFQEDLVHFIRGDEEFPRITVPAGSLVIREGDTGDAAYILVRGRCEAFQTDSGKRHVLRSMGPGEIFGEAALLTDGARSASVVALEESVLVVINRNVLDAELSQMKPWLATLVRTLADRFRDIDLKLRTLSDARVDMS